MEWLCVFVGVVQDVHEDSLNQGVFPTEISSRIVLMANPTSVQEWSIGAPFFAYVDVTSPF